MIGEFSNPCIFVVLVSQSDASSSNIQVAPRSKSMSELHDEEQKQTRPGATEKKIKINIKYMMIQGIHLWVIF